MEGGVEVRTRHSHRSVANGSIGDARGEGRYAAAADAASTITTPSRQAVRSKVSIITSTDAITRDIPSASAAPVNAPMAASFIDCFNTSVVTARVVAPNA